MGQNTRIIYLTLSIADPEDNSPRVADAVVVKASADGLQSSTVSIPVSTDLERNGMLAVAERSVTKNH